MRGWTHGNHEDPRPPGRACKLTADAIAYHEDNDCCTASQPCKDRAKLATLLEQDGGSAKAHSERGRTPNCPASASAGGSPTVAAS